MKSPVKELVGYEMATMVEESLHDVLKKTFHNAQGGVQYVVYNIDDQVMLDLPSEEFIGETSDSHITQFLETDETAEGLLKRLLTFTCFIAPIVTFLGVNPMKQWSTRSTVSSMRQKS